MKSCIFKVLNQRRKACVHLNALFKIKVLYLVFMVQWKKSMEPFNCTESFFIAEQGSLDHLKYTSHYFKNHLMKEWFLYGITRGFSHWVVIGPIHQSRAES